MNSSVNKEFAAAIRQITSEKGVSEAVILESVEAALVSAFKRTYPNSPEVVSVHLDPSASQVKVIARKRVVDEVTDPINEVTPAEARKLGWSGVPEQPLELDITPPQSFGRIAAQTARGVVLQRLREAERDKIFEEFVNREGEIVTGLIRRLEAKTYIVDLGKVEAILPPSEQTPRENYRMGQRLKVYLLEVQRSHKGLQVIVSRAHRHFLKRLFELEVPEIFSGVVEIKGIAREPGTRSKIAVYSRQEGVDPVGACVGMRGIRILNVVNELNGEKIDVVPWHADPAIFVANALSPAQVESVDVGEAQKVATVLVPERQLSLAIGKEGQNARLAAKLTGWRIDIKNADALRPPPRPVVPDDADENQEMTQGEQMSAVESSVVESSAVESSA